jgi:hypothetical protein
VKEKQLNNYHRYLDLPINIIKPEKFNLSLNEVTHLKNLEYDYSYIDEFLSSIGLRVKKCEGFFTGHNQKVPTHTDGTTHVKINKTWGPDTGVTRWYTSKKIIDRSNNNKNLEIIEKYPDEIKFSEEEDCDLVYEASTNELSLVNVSGPHGTYNPSLTQGRWTLAIDIGNDHRPSIYWDEALEYFKNYIIDRRL